MRRIFWSGSIAVIIVIIFVVLVGLTIISIKGFGVLASDNDASAASNPEASCSSDEETQKQYNQALKYYTNYTSCLKEKHKLEGNLIAYQGVETQLSNIMEDYNRLQRWFYLCQDYTPPLCPMDYTMINIGCSSSMKPTFDCNYRPHVYKPRGKNDLRVCDVISYIKPDDKRIFHRIIASNGTAFITKGDATIVVDSYQPSFEDVEWKVCYN